MTVSDEPVIIAMGLTTGTLLALGCCVFIDMFFRPRAGRIEVATTRGGLELPPTAVMRWSGPVAAVLVLLFAGLLAMSGSADFTYAPRRYHWPTVGVILGLVVLGGILHSPPSPARVPRLVLTPHGIGTRRGDRTRVLDWDAIVPPNLRIGKRVDLVVRHPIKVPPAGADPLEVLDTPMVEVPIGRYASDPNLVLALIEHYRTHPEDRAELAGPEVVDRLRRGDFAAWQGLTEREKPGVAPMAARRRGVRPGRRMRRAR